MSVSVFVINLPRSVDRRERMEKELGAAGLDYRFVEAVDGKALGPDLGNYNREKRLRYFGRDLSPAEIGCLLSHRKIYEMMVEEDIPAALILEDDVTISDKGFKALLDALPEAGTPWDVIRFLDPKREYKVVAPLMPGYDFVRPYGIPGGGHAYVLTRTAAQVMLAHTENVWRPIDTILGLSWKTGLRTLSVLPCPVVVNIALESTIGDERFDKTLQVEGLQRALFPLFRGWYKLGETLAKRLSYWFPDILRAFAKI